MARHPRPFGPLPDHIFRLREEPPAAPLEARTFDIPINVTDDWPEFVPVTDREARIIEAFFADLLDELFGPIP
ncbi:hypothetical protein [Caulobacter soli]|uniref:hypothetical protein n=1 Tax=Caulobacter soli TaxID=2708539 RepID=UPI0013EBBB8C|nr:hypothetical protein [Caulobacter soli]